MLSPRMVPTIALEIYSYELKRVLSIEKISPIRDNYIFQRAYCVRSYCQISASKRSNSTIYIVYGDLALTPIVQVTEVRKQGYEYLCCKAGGKRILTIIKGGSLTLKK
jgi:hypothetical protein